MDISAVILGFNEQEQLPKLFESVKEVSEILFIDHNSTDDTAKVAKELGARVIVREFPHDIVTQSDCDEFEKRFGYKPEFKAGYKVYNGGKERYIASMQAKNDWVLNIDCDEIVTWDIKKVKEKMVDADVVDCKFVHIHNPDGTPNLWYQTSKLYNRTKIWWEGRVHEAINGYNLRVAWCDDMVIDHWQREREYRSTYIYHLEYQALKDQDARRLFYMGKEYHNYHQYEKAIFFLTLYLKEAIYIQEKVKAYVIIAQCMWELGREDEAWIYAMQGLKLNPRSKEIYLFLAKLAGKKQEAIWLKHAELAEEEHLV